MSVTLQSAYLDKEKKKALASLIKAAAMLLSAAGMVAAQNPFYLNTSDRVLFYGGATPLGRLETALVETYVATRFPQLGVEFAHRGWDGRWTSSSVQEILDLKPSVLVLGIGPPETGETGKAGDATAWYGEVVHRLREKAPGLRIVLAPPSRAAGDALRAWSQEENVMLYQTEAAAPGATVAETLLGAGSGLLQLWQAPAEVSIVEISAPAKSVLRSDNTSVRELEADEKVVFWSEDDTTLPLPSELMIVGGAALERLNVHRLRVRGLLAGRHKLTIDGWTMGTFESGDFEAGIDLSKLPTPMLKQASMVLQLTLEHIGNQYARWETLAAGKRPAEEEETAETKTLERRGIAGKPLTRDYEIVPVP